MIIGKVGTEMRPGDREAEASIGPIVLWLSLLNIWLAGTAYLVLTRIFSLQPLGSRIYLL